MARLSRDGDGQPPGRRGPEHASPVVAGRPACAHARANRLQSSQGQLQTLADRLISAQEEERTRIARDLHDDLGQRLVSLSIALSNLKRRVAESGDDTLRRDLATLQEQAAQASSDLRHLSHDLHPGALEHMGLSDALRARCAEFTEEAGVRARLIASEDWNDPTDAIALCLYRVAQEALRNVAQHAHASHATVSLERLNSHVRMRVSDDGRGFDVATTALVRASD